MKKLLAMVAAVFLVISLAEVAYTLSQPLLGEGDLESMTEVPEFKIMFTHNYFRKNYTYHLGENFENTSGIYKSLYNNRPHVNEVEVPMYKLAVVGTELLDAVQEGADLYSMGVLNPIYYSQTNMSYEEFSNWTNENPIESRKLFHNITKNYRAAGMGSSYFDLRNLKSYSYTGNVYEPGEMLMSIRPSWYLLTELSGGTSLMILKEDFAEHLNVTHDEFIKEYANMEKVYLKRLEFAKNVLDTGGSEGGFLFLAYYHNYGKLWGILFGIPEEEAASGKLTIDGKEKDFELIYPFIFIDADMDDGKHTVALETDIDTYSLDIDVDKKYGYKSLDNCAGLKELNFLEMRMDTDGVFKLIVYSEDAVDIKDAKIRQPGGAWSGSIAQDNLGEKVAWENILLTITNSTLRGEAGEKYDLEVKIVFEKDGKLMEEVALCKGRYEPA